MSKVLYNNNLIMTLSYNVYENDDHYFIKADFGNGNILTDPYLISLSLLTLNFNILKELKNELSEKKICQYFRNSIPYNELLYSLTGGDYVYDDPNLSFKWDYDIALSFWKNELDDLLQDCFTLYDLILVFVYFKYEIVIKNFGEFVSKLPKKDLI